MGVRCATREWLIVEFVEAASHYATVTRAGTDAGEDSKLKRLIETTSARRALAKEALMRHVIDHQCCAALPSDQRDP